MKRKMLLFTLALPVILCQPALAQTSSRLIAQADWVNNGAAFSPLDSTSYSYSGTRGGDLTHKLKFDNATTWDFLGDTAYTNAFMYLQTFDGNNNIVTNITEYWSGTGWVLQTNDLYTYDTANRLASMIVQTWGGTSWVPVSKDVYTYVGSNLVEDLYQLWNGLTSTFSNSSEKYYFYDPVSGDKTNETDINLASGSPVNTIEYNYTYTGTGQLLTTTNLTWNGASWIPNTMYTNTYDSSGNRISNLYQTYNSTTSAWVSDTLHTYSNFTGTLSNPQTDLLQAWDTAGGGMWVNVMQFTYAYNAYNQLTSLLGESYNIVGAFEFASGDPMSNYYYQTYGTSNVSVKNVVGNGNEVNVYPVPAQNMLHVDLNWAVGQSASISIYDAQGRIVNQWDAPAGTQYFSAISVNYLASGTYFVKVNGAQGQIVKQFVIAH